MTPYEVPPSVVEAAELLIGTRVRVTQTLYEMRFDPKRVRCWLYKNIFFRRPFTNTRPGEVKINKTLFTLTRPLRHFLRPTYTQIPKDHVVEGILTAIKPSEILVQFCPDDDCADRFLSIEIDGRWAGFLDTHTTIEEINDE